ncbi:MAG: hypothetical protein WCI05_07505 [Myxococcales bacterium]
MGTRETGVLLFSLAFASCSSSTSTSNPYSPSTTKVILEVDYATGAAPYTGPVGGRGDLWSLFESNAQRLFQGKQLEIPHDLDHMEELTDVAAGDYTADQILQIASKHRATASSGSSIAYYVVWLPGYFNDGTEVNKAVLGVNLGSSGVIAMFKPVILSSSGTPLIQKYVEQSTLVHEFGHVVGLVNKGIPLTSAHHDAANGAHCTNTDCVMYWLNEGAADAVKFIEKRATESTTVLFANDCLADVDAVTK